VYGLLIDSTGILIATTRTGFFRSTDKGNSWTRVHTYVGGSASNRAEVTRAPNGTLYADGGFHIYRSRDNGVTWQQCYPLGCVIGGFGDPIAVAPNNDVYVTTVCEGRYVLRSTNEGSSWFAPGIINWGGGRATSFAFNALGHIFASSSLTGLRRSTDNGATWGLVGGGMPDSIFVRSLGSSKAGNLFASTSQGAYRSTDQGANWELLSIPIYHAGWFGRPMNSGYIYLSLEDWVHFSSDEGHNWTTWSRTDVPAAFLADDSDQYLFAGQGNYPYVFRTISSMTPPQSPILESPPNGSIVDSTRVHLVWHQVSGVLNYAVQVAVDPAFTNLALVDTLVTDTTREVTLSANTRYYWRVRAKKFFGINSLFSDVWNLRIAPSMPPYPGWQVYNTLNSGIPSNSVFDLCHESPVVHWVGGTRLARFDGSIWQPFLWSPSAIAVDSEGVKWVGANVEGVYRFDGLNWQGFNTTNSGLPSDQVRAIAVDQNNVKWIGTADSGLARFDDSTWTVYTTSNSGLPSNLVSSISIDAQQKKWIGTSSGGLAVLDGSLWTVFNTDNSGIPNNTVWNVTISSRDVKWVGTGYGLGAFNDTTWTNYYTWNSGLPRNSVSCTSIDEYGTVWIGTAPGGGLARFDGTNWTIFGPSNSGLPDTNVNAIAPDQSGNMWIGTSFGGLAVYREGGRPILPPRLASPMDGANNQPILLDLLWNPPSDGKDRESKIPRRRNSVLTYRVQVFVDSTFIMPVVDDSTVQTENLQIGPLAHGTQYFWRVRVEGEDHSPFSSIWKFHTVIPAPVSPGLLTPLDSSISNEPNIYLIWQRNATAETYRLQVATDTAFSSLVVDDSTLVDSSRYVSNLQPLTWYHWHVNAKNIGGTSGYSQRWSFKTMGTPTQVALLAPPNNAVNQPTSMIFFWQRAADQTLKPKKFGGGKKNVEGIHKRADLLDGASKNVEAVSNPQIVEANGKNKVLTVSAYWFELDTDTLGQSVVRDTTLNDTTRSVANLSHLIAYYWRVRAKNGIGWGRFSPWWKFTTMPPLPEQVTLVSPANNVAVNEDSVRFAWRRAVPGVTRYCFQWATDSSFANSDVDSTLTDTTRIVRQLVNNQDYWWRVRATNIAGWGPFSGAWKLRVIITGVDELEDIPTVFSLTQNYPNPWNPSTQIRYALPHTSFVTLTVYNTLGQQVAQLVNEQQQAGYHDVVFRGDQLASGVYFYQLRAGAFVETKKLVLMK
jgi:hypothetical protein